MIVKNEPKLPGRSSSGLRELCFGGVPSLSVMICPPLSLFVITAIPHPFNRYIARFARNPQLDPSCVRYHPSPPFLDHKPDGKRPRRCRRGHFECRAARKQLSFATQGFSADSSEINQHSSAKPISVPVIPIRRSERSDAGEHPIKYRRR